MINTVTTMGTNYIINSNPYTINNSYTILDDITGSTGLMYSYRRTTNTKYSTTVKTVLYKGHDHPIFVSHTGRSFIFLMSKNGVEYKKYIK